MWKRATEPVAYMDDLYQKSTTTLSPGLALELQIGGKSYDRRSTERLHSEMSKQIVTASGVLQPMAARPTRLAFRLRATKSRSASHVSKDSVGTDGADVQV